MRGKAVKDRSLTNYGYNAVFIKKPSNAADPEMETVSNKASRRSWARLMQKIYEIDPLMCPQCGHVKKVIAVITDPHEVRKILACLKRNNATSFYLEAIHNFYS